jgi:hypothetical protein
LLQQEPDFTPIGQYEGEAIMGEWTLFSNHGHVLVCLAKNNQARLRDVAAEVGITERAVQNILRELQGSGLVQVSKHGRCNHYQINTRKPLRHPLEAHCTVGKLLQMLQTETSGAAAPASPAPVKATRKPTSKDKDEPARAETAKADPPKAQTPKTDPPAKGDSKAKDEKPRTRQEPPATQKAEAKKTEPKKSAKPDNQQGSLF